MPKLNYDIDYHVKYNELEAVVVTIQTDPVVQKYIPRHEVNMILAERVHNNKKFYPDKKV